MGVIAGVWRRDRNPSVKEACRAILDGLNLWSAAPPRSWHNDGIAIGCRDGSLADGRDGCLVWDGRLDNLTDIAEQLGVTAQAAAALAPAEVAIGAIARWGDAGIARLVGDFALAHWSAEHQRLTLARSACGFQPLFFHDGPHLTAFASMPRGLHALPQVPIEIDEDKIAERLLLQLSFDDNSCFRNIRRVEPGSIVEIRPAGADKRRYWYPENVPALRLRGAREYEEALRAKFDEAVRSRIAGHAKIGTQLSGGRDSTLVTATAAKLLAPSGGRVSALTAAPRSGYDGLVSADQFADESAHAAAVAAQHRNIDHSILRTDPAVTVLDELDRVYRYYEQPAGDVANMSWVHRTYREAQRQGLSTMLIAIYGNLSTSYSGDALLAQLLRRGQVVRAWQEGRALVRRHAKRPMSAAAMALRPFIPRWAWTGLWRARDRERDAALSVAAIHPDWLQRILNGKTRLRPSFVNRPGFDSIVSRTIPLIGSDTGHLTKGARAIWGLDLSDPTADRRVVEFCLSVPEEYYLRDGRRAALLRGAFTDRLPPVVLNEERRGYQSADWHEMLVRSRAALLTELELLKRCDLVGQMLDLNRMKLLVETMPTANWHDRSTTFRYRTLLLNAFAFGHFLRNVAGA